MDLETLDMLRTSLRHVLTDDGGGPLGARLDELGWDEVLADDAAAAQQVLFEVKGETVAGADALGPLLGATLAESLEAPDLAGSSIVLPLSLHPERLSTSRAGDELFVSGYVLSPPGEGQTTVVPFAGATGVELAVFDAPLASEPTSSHRTDTSLELYRVEVSVPTASVLRWSRDAAAAPAWTAAVAAGRWALGAELVGIGRQVIGDAVAYTSERKQYGRAIGTFQALQHRLASAYVTVVGASKVVSEASSTGSPWAATVAKAMAGRAAEVACTQAQQCYGAIGFTWEHGFHRYLRRSYALDRILGDWRTLEVEIGEQLQRTGEVPKLGAL